MPSSSKRTAKAKAKPCVTEIATICSEKKVWQGVLLLDATGALASFFDSGDYPAMRKEMLCTLGLHKLADLDPLEQNKKMIPANDIALSVLEGKTGTAKLTHWVSAMFADGNHARSRDEEEIVLFIMAFMLWTDAPDDYNDLYSLTAYLMTTDEVAIAGLMCRKVFQKQATAEAGEKLGTIVLGIKDWLHTSLAHKKTKYGVGGSHYSPDNSFVGQTRTRKLMELAQRHPDPKVVAGIRSRIAGPHSPASVTEGPKGSKPPLPPSPPPPPPKDNGGVADECLRVALHRRVDAVCAEYMSADTKETYGVRVLRGFMQMDPVYMDALIDMSNKDFAQEVWLMIDTVRGTDEVCAKHAGSSTLSDDEAIEAECHAAALKFAEQRAADAQRLSLGQQIQDAMKHERDHGERLPPPHRPDLKSTIPKSSFSDECHAAALEFDKRYAAEYAKIGEKRSAEKAERQAKFKERAAAMRRRIEAAEAKVGVGIGVDKDGTQQLATFHLAPPPALLPPPPPPPPPKFTNGADDLLTHDQKVKVREAIEMMPDAIRSTYASEVAIAIHYVICNGEADGAHLMGGSNVAYVQGKVDKLRDAGGTAMDMKMLCSVLMCESSTPTEAWAEWSKWVNWFGPDLRGRPRSDSRNDLPIVRTPRCRFMYDILSDWRAVVDAATSRHFLDVSYPSLPEYIQERWDAVSVEEKWKKYGMPFADERDAIAKAKGKNWSETSRLETAPNDSEDEWFDKERYRSPGSSDDADDSDDSDPTDLDEPAPAAPNFKTTNTTPQDDAWWFMRKEDEPIYVHLEKEPFEEDYLVIVREYHRTNQDRQPRPARIATMSDWPFPLPFKTQTLGGMLCPSNEIEDLSHKRSYTVQRYRMELEGALGWMDLEFHPFSNVAQRLRQLLTRNRYLNLSEYGPKVNTSRYHRAVAQIRDCHHAIHINDPGAFRQAMPVFCERVFADESQSLQNDTHLSSYFADMLLILRKALGKVKKLVGWAPIFATAEEIVKAKGAAWVPVINELAAKADCIGAMVVDALCVGTGQASCENFTDFVFNEDVFPCARALRNVAFTDRTAPLFLTSYWEKRPVFALNVEGSSRIACSLSPRARFADTKYTESLQGLLKAHEVFIASRRVDAKAVPAETRDDVLAHTASASSNADLLKRSYSGGQDLRDALKDSIACSHYQHWTSQQMMHAGCTLLLYARRMRCDLVAFRKEHPTSERNLWVQEIYINVDQAMELFDLVHVIARTHLKKGEQSPMPALSYLLEARRVRAHWLDEDSKHGRHAANLAREERKRCKRRIADCVAAACAAVRLRARKADQQAELDEANEALRQMQEEQALTERRLAAYKCIARHVSWSPRVVRRKASRVQRRMDEQVREAREKVEAKANAEKRARGLAIAIEINRAAVARRAGAPARRVEEQKRWAKAVAKEAADQKAKEKLERAAKLKAEQEVRAERLRAEAEEAERGREAREAKRKREAAAEARIAAAAAAVERQRQQAAALEAARREQAAVAAREVQLRRHREEALQRQQEAEQKRRQEEWAEEQRRIAAEEQERRRALREMKRAAAETAKAERARQRQEREEAERRYWATEKRNVALLAMEAKRESASMARALQAFRNKARLRCLVQEHVCAYVCYNRWRRRGVCRIKALKLWRARVRATHTARALRKPKSPPPPAALPPPLPPDPKPEIGEADVDRLSERPHATGAKWQEDYRSAITVAQQESQRQLYNKCGWASGYDGWFMMGGWDLVNAQTRARQQHDVQLATFQANFKLQQRVQQAQLKQAKQALSTAWKSSVKRFSDKMAELDTQRAQVEEMEERTAELERQRIKLRDRAQARMMQLDMDAEATEADRATLSAELCARLRNRPAAGPGVSLAVDECLLCMDAECTHIARACLHVIGCASCCEELNRKQKPCPICKAPTTFAAMRYP